ncbi:unnamed protein product [Rhizophagus irregularis]|nr:unnamed protein product [Rhizophagus irregularis]CAB4479537.1 unnamed protein product [Rhizophagus irregularis]CAB5388872.1 unnamed protein product [Rhizophagus irregularis]
MRKVVSILSRRLQKTDLRNNCGTIGFSTNPGNSLKSIDIGLGEWRKTYRRWDTKTSLKPSLKVIEVYSNDINAVLCGESSKGFRSKVGLCLFYRGKGVISYLNICQTDLFDLPDEQAASRSR